MSSPAWLSAALPRPSGSSRSRAAGGRSENHLPPLPFCTFLVCTPWLVPLVLLGGLLVTFMALAFLAWIQDVLDARRSVAGGDLSDEDDQVQSE